MTVSEMALKDQRRHDLLNAASELLAIKPTASLADIADYAKIGKATLHRYFPTRDDLMLALGYRALEDVARIITDCRLEEGTVLEALTRLIEALIPLGDKLHFLLHDTSLDHDAEFAVAEATTNVPILTLIQRGQAAGELRSDLSAEWMLYHLNYALFATWQSVHEGFVARREAAHLLTTTLLVGIVRR